MLGWTRETCARFAETTPATIQNIERGRSPLTLAIAQALEAATDCRASRLFEAAEYWRQDISWTKAAPLLGVLGGFYNKHNFEMHCISPIDPEQCTATIAEVQERAGMLLHALQHKPHDFRIAHRRIEQCLNKARTELSVSDAALSEAASRNAVVLDLEMTVAELANFEDAVQAIEWISSPRTKHLRPDDLLKVTLETFRFWEAGSSVVRDEERVLREDDDYGHERTTWRIRLPDGSQVVVPRTWTTGHNVQHTLQVLRGEAKGGRKRSKNRR